MVTNVFIAHFLSKQHIYPMEYWAYQKVFCSIFMTFDKNEKKRILQGKRKKKCVSQNKSKKNRKK